MHQGVALVVVAFGRVRLGEGVDRVLDSGPPDRARRRARSGRRNEPLRSRSRHCRRHAGPAGRASATDRRSRQPLRGWARQSDSEQDGHAEPMDPGQPRRNQKAQSRRSGCVSHQPKSRQRVCPSTDFSCEGGLDAPVDPVDVAVVHRHRRDLRRRRRCSTFKCIDVELAPGRVRRAVGEVLAARRS